MVATSSTCSLMNHCMNCSEAKSLSSRAVRSRALICSVTRFSWASASSTGATTSSKVGDRGLDAGDDDLAVGVEEVLHHHHRVVALLERLAVEERRHLRHRQGVVVDRDGDVLVVGGELVADLPLSWSAKRARSRVLLLQRRGRRPRSGSLGQLLLGDLRAVEADELAAA